MAVANSLGIGAQTAAAEKEKYEECWNDPYYRSGKGGLDFFSEFLEKSDIRPGDTAIDYGCGEGLVANELFNMGVQVKLIDIAENCLSKQVKAKLGKHFIHQDLAEKIHEKASFGFCSDTMEHIPPESVDIVLRNILGSCKRCFFHISIQSDAFGQRIGKVLHLSVHNYVWWDSKFKFLKTIIFSSRQTREYVIFYVGLE